MNEDFVDDVPMVRTASTGLKSPTTALLLLMTVVLIIVVTATTYSVAAASQIGKTVIIRTPGSSRIGAVSCVSEGNCIAVGSSSKSEKPFLVNETSGSWGKFREFPDRLGTFNTSLTSISCSRRGECLAGGVGSEKGGGLRPVLIAEHNGVWTAAPSDVLSFDRSVTNKSIDSLSCAPNGGCEAVGFGDHGHDFVSFAIEENRGVWSKPESIPPHLNTSTGFQVQRVSCAGSGNCVAAGLGYARHGLLVNTSVVVEHRGVWGSTVNVAGNLNLEGASSVRSISCRAVDCLLDAVYFKGSNEYPAFFSVSDQNGKWGPGKLIDTGVASNQYFDFRGLSCSDGKDCINVGEHEVKNSRPFRYRAFVERYARGHWLRAQVEVPGGSADKSSQYSSVSCTPMTCIAGGEGIFDGRQDAVIVTFKAS